MDTSPDGERLRDRVRQLEQLVEQQADRIAELEAELEADRDTGGWSRRSILASAATAAGIGALTGRVQAAPSYSSATGQVGTSAEPVSDVITQSLRANSAQVDGDLRLATGQSIEDGSGTVRLKIASGRTQLSSEAGVSNQTPFLRLVEGQNMYQINTGGTVEISDDLGSFRAVQYTASSSAPGTLELTNSILMSKSWDSWVGYPVGINLSGYSSSESIRLRFNDNSAREGALWVESGEMKARDTNGNITTLT